jgi:two-component system chemotaxis response regulator CheY
MTTCVLVVDDSTMVRMMVCEALAADGYQVQEACDGREALAIVKTVTPNLVVTDINMPEMDGISLIRALRELPEHRMTPILVLSSEAGDDIIRNGRNAGATGWMVKPFDADQLRSTARYVLELHRKALLKSTPLNGSSEGAIA